MTRTALRFTSLLAVTLALSACGGLSVVGGVEDAAVDAPDDLARLDIPATDTAPDAPPDASVDAAPDVTPDVAPMDTPPTDGSGRCTSDGECVGNAGGAVCDVATGRCVECLAARDTCPTGRYCDATSNRCLMGCRDDMACGPTSAPDAGGAPSTARCNLTTRACVECVTDDHCPAGMLCVGNTCVTGCTGARPCPGTQTCCAGACVDTVSNVAHCGMCSNRCTAPNATAACMNSMCAVGMCTAPFADCDRTAANGCEANTLTDAAHCGGCGMACPTRPHARSSCDAGRCAFACDVGFADCDGNADNGCEVDLNADTSHCGACRALCNPPNAVAACVTGRCTVASCAAGFGDCDMNATNGCEVDTSTAVSHCGRCGNACPARANAFPGCLGGRCVTSCVMGYQDCDGVESNGCEVDVRSDLANCGSCGRACNPAHATGSCAAGRCAIMACDEGFADCDMDASNGCEVNLRGDTANCGACGTRCNTPGATPACAAGRCDIAACTMGRADCDMTVSNGCEVDVTADTTHCGACGTRCALANATASCATGRCAVASCDAGYADCDGNPTNGCEAPLNTSVAHCGRCGMMCTFPGSSAACERGMCRIASCSAGLGDCDGNAANGCEATLATDARNCGACGMLCAVANGTPACTSGRCVVAACNAGFADCNGNPADGCEVNTRSDAANCGSCGMRCSTPGATPACASGRCDIAACDSGRADCNASATDGCEVTLATDTRNCGACGAVCDLANAAATCAGGRCAVGTCNTGFADCDGNPANGCEALLATDARNCGACGTTCAPTNGTGVCASSRCAVVACNPGYADCDGVASNGCEVNIAADTSNCGGCGTRCALANATPACSAGRCAVSSCAAGYSDCNSAPADGCEVNTAGDASNCGSCGRRCALANTASNGCAGGACTVLACVSGYGNCNGAAADGCESNLSTDVANCGACGARPAELCNLADDNCNGVCDDRSGCKTGVYRSYHGGTGEHFYTASASEAVCCGFSLEYANFYYLYSAPAPGLVPFYRCYMEYGKHFYTTASNCETGRGTNEGILGYIAGGAVCGAVPLYRVYRGSNGDHFYTTSADERDAALRGGYTNEGVAGYVWTAP